jgi:hypothetical protein
MAIEPIDKRIEGMTTQRKVTSTAPGIEVSYMTDEPLVPANEPELNLAPPDEAAGESAIEMPIEPDLTKPVFVAGVGGLRGILKKESKALMDKAAGKPDASVQPIAPVEIGEDGLPKIVKKDGQTLIPEAPEATVQAVGEAVTARATARELGDMPSMKPPEEVFNTTRMADNVADIVNGTSDALGIETKTVTFAEIVNKANDIGIDEKFLNRLLTPDGKMMPSAVDTYRAMQVLETSAGELDRLFKKVNAGDATEPELLQLRQQITMHGMIQKSVKGLQSETARALAIMRVPRDANVNLIRQTLEEGGGINSLKDLARAYMSTGLSPAAKSKLLERSMLETVKDVWFTTWINGLLSSPPTHAKNIVGNMGFGIYRMPERMLAGLYGRMPDSMRVARESMNPMSPLFKNIDPLSAQQRVELDEVLNGMQALSGTLSDGWRLASKAFKDNAPADPLSKLELGGQYGPRDINAAIFGQSDDTLFGKGINLYGKAVTLPGRMLMAEDEFFKGIFYQNAMRDQIGRRARSVYRQAVAAGDDEASAFAKAEIEVRDLFANPPEDLTESAMEAARRGTFTMELPPGLKKIEELFQHPALKIFVPFFRTPSNIALEVIERTPFAPVSSRFRADMAKGGPSRDLALAKVSMGSMVMYGISELAAEGYLTGSMPGRKADREAFQRAGGQAYALVLPRSSFSEGQIEKLSAAGKVTLGDDKIYFSFQGLEPVGAMLAIGADYAKYAANTENNDEINTVFGASVYAMYNYMASQPALQGFSDIMTLMKGFQSGEVNVEDFTNGLVKQVGSFAIGGSPFGAYSSAVAGIERYMDPNATDTSVKGLDLPIGVAGFYEALKQYQSRNPAFSDNLPPRLNLWGEVVQQGKGNLTELIMPTRVTAGEFAPVDQVLFELGSPITMPKREIGGIELRADQYNQLITIYAKEFNAKQVLTNLIYTPGFTLLRDGVKQQQLSKTHDQLMDAARKTLISRDPELRNKMAELEAMKLDNMFAKP